VAPGRLAAAAAGVGATFVQVSTNEVFDGEADAPYTETDATRAINPYAASKLAGEEAVMEADTDHLIVRTAWIFGPGGRNFPSRIVAAAQRAAAAGEPLRVVADEWGNPTWAPDLAAAMVRAVELGARGVLHLAGEPAASRYELARAILAGMERVRIEPISQADYPRPAPVPPRAVLSMARARGLGIGPLDWREPAAGYARRLLAEDGA
jgi:dTDP-4-dehydrorhamnose reductase